MPVSQICHESHSRHFPDYPYSRHTIEAFHGVHQDIERDYKYREYCFIDMSQLCFYPGRIETLLMQNSAHCVAKTMSSGSAAITDTSD